LVRIVKKKERDFATANTTLHEMLVHASPRKVVVYQEYMYVFSNLIVHHVKFKIEVYIM
jgi:hypothetical protein